jgi:hypothetical protein
MKPTDPTSIGLILVSMGMITEEQLAKVVELQERSTIDYLIGRLAISEGLITSDQLEDALSAQAGLRSKSKPKRALAQAKIAELSVTVLTHCATRLRARATAERRERTREYPTVRTPMLAKSGEE